MVDWSALAWILFPYPPLMVAAVVPGVAEFTLAPPITFGAPFALGSSLSARPLFTHNSNGWLSMVPTKFRPGVVPELPNNVQKRLSQTEQSATWAMAGSVPVVRPAATTRSNRRVGFRFC